MIWEDSSDVGRNTLKWCQYFYFCLDVFAAGGKTLEGNFGKCLLLIEKALEDIYY